MSGPSPRLIVIGVDGSRESDGALRFAADEAKLRSALLRIVCAWEPSASGYLGEAFAPTPDTFVEAEPA
jgi:nucleotide-binding universal stress UspA family protein